MRGKSKWSLLIVLVLALGVFLTACGNGGSSNNSKGNASKDNTGSTGKSSSTTTQLASNQEIDFAAADDIPTLDYTQSTDTTSGNVLEMTTSGLTRMHNDKMSYDLAAGPPKVETKSNGNVVYTFTLRDSKWSDGKAVTAQDFVYGWQHENDPKSKPQYNFVFASAHILNAAKIQDPKDPMYGKVDQLGIKALDDKTVQITLSQATPFFESILSFTPFSPARQDIVEKYGNKYAQDADKMVYNGPFILANWDHGKSWTYQKNPNYWNVNNIKLAKSTWTVVKDQGTRVNMYKTGQIQETGLSGDFIDAMKASNPSEVVQQPTSFMNYLYVQTAHQKILGNQDARQALDMAINRKDFVNVLLKDGSTPAHYVVPKGFVNGPDGKDFHADSPNGWVNGSVDQAKKLWAKAQAATGVKTVTINLLTPDGDTYTKYDQYIANQLETNLKGVKVKVNQQPWGNYLKLYYAKNFDLSFSGWSPDYRDPMTYLDLYTKGNSQNVTGWSSPEYDNLIHDAQTQTDASKRWADLQKADEVLTKSAAVLPLFQSGHTFAVKPNVKGLNFPMYGPQVDFMDAYVTK